MPRLAVPAPALVIKLAVIALGVAVISHADSGDLSAANVTVNVGDFWFCNSSFNGSVCPTTVRTGDTVTWSWVGAASHTTTACSDGTFTTCGAAQGWDSGGKTGAGMTFQRSFNNAGTFFYRCQIHPTMMRGRIEVSPDTDGDGWSDAAERTIGTDPLRRCGTDAWPADINNDTFSDISDLVILTNNFGLAAPPAPKRQDIAPDPVPDGFVDISDVASLLNFFGQHCTP